MVVTPKSAKKATKGVAKRHQKKRVTVLERPIDYAKLRYLAQRSGILFMQPSTKAMLSSAVNEWLTKVVHTARDFLQSAGKRRTFSVDDIKYALRRHGIRYLGAPPKSKAKPNPNPKADKK